MVGLDFPDEGTEGREGAEGAARHTFGARPPGETLALTSRALRSHWRALSEEGCNPTRLFSQQLLEQHLLGAR